MIFVVLQHIFWSAVKTRTSLLFDIVLAFGHFCSLECSPFLFLELGYLNGMECSSIFDFWIGSGDCSLLFYI